MKKFLINIACLAVIVIAVDIITGKAMQYMINHANGGDTKKIKLITDEIEDKVLIFGSSRACHHYNPEVIEDSLGVTCYNCGRDGNGIIFNYALYRLVSARYTPRMIVYDISAFDLESEADNTKYLAALKPYYDREGIDSIFWSVEEKMKWKMTSKMYRYNSDFIGVLSDYLHPLHQNIKGYKPTNTAMKGEMEAVEEKDEYDYDELKLYYLKRLVSDCKRNGTKLVFTLSPLYKASSTAKFLPAIELAEKESIPFISFYTDKELNLNTKYFSDRSHMNGNGATAFTMKLASKLKSLND